MHLIKSIIFYLRALDKLPPCPPLKSPNLVFRVKITVHYRHFFQKQNVISQVLALSCNKPWPFYHKNNQINPPAPGKVRPTSVFYSLALIMYLFFSKYALIFYFCCSKLPLTDGHFLPFSQITY